MHDLRHTHASNLIDKEIYPPVIQKRLGHSTLDQTMSTYAHFFDKHDKKMVDTLVTIQGGKRGTFLSFCFENPLLNILEMVDMQMGEHP